MGSHGGKVVVRRATKAEAVPNAETQDQNRDRSRDLPNVVGPAVVIVVAPDLVLGPVIADVPAVATGAVVAMDAVEAMAVVAVATGATDMAAEVVEVVMAGDVDLVLPPEAP